ncbi:MAG: hypothetical protein EOO90_03625 [Pedobacter sp.]|nr:MAG: hypothetical protein EOO90_03625 [Pedobacter sp.]
MLAQFTWGEFLVAMALLNALWYGMMVLVLYRKELSGVLSGLGGSSNSGKWGGRGSGWKTPALSPAPEGLELGKELDMEKLETAVKKGTGNAETESLMGASRLPEGVEVISSAQVAFSGGIGEGKYEQVGLVADVVQELKLLFLELEKSDQGKPEFLVRLREINEEYGPLAGHPNLGAINAFILERAGFHLNSDELDNLWY